ncbi:hypothetical protein COOONC_26709 [Cooperia oncophora]
MNVKVMDALVYLEQTSERSEKEKLDMLFVDLAGPVHESGLSCPPAIFLTDTVLCNMKNSLTSNGVIAMNLVTRDEEVAHKAKRSLADHFPTLFSIRSEEDVNEVLNVHLANYTLTSEEGPCHVAVACRLHCAIVHKNRLVGQ